MIPCRLLALVLVVFSICSAHSQEKSAPTQPEKAPAPCCGEVVDGVYHNAYFDMTYPLQADWRANQGAVSSAKAPSGTWFLLVADRHTGGKYFDRIILVADNASSTPTARQYLEKFLRAMKTQAGTQSLGVVYEMSLSGNTFYRADLKQTEEGVDLFKTVLCTRSRDAFLIWTIASTSQDTIDEVAGAMGKAQFARELPRIIPACKDRPKPSPEASAAPKITYSARVSQGVSRALLCSQVQPVYPIEAREKRIQGKVIFNAVINTDGTVKELKPASGHPLLVDAARDAVMQWRYNPFIIQNRPLEMETQIVVEFTLAGN